MYSWHRQVFLSTFISTHSHPATVLFDFGATLTWVNVRLSFLNIHCWSFLNLTSSTHPWDFTLCIVCPYHPIFLERSPVTFIGPLRPYLASYRSLPCLIVRTTVQPSTPSAIASSHYQNFHALHHNIIFTKESFSFIHYSKARVRG